MRYNDFSDLHVAEIMTRWPATIGVFMDFRMHCIGCPIGHFHTLVDAAEEHGIALDLLSAEVATAIETGGPRRGFSGLHRPSASEVRK